jgi:hypothetical protein
MLYQEINQADFISAFKSIRPDSFSYEGLKALFNYLEGESEDCDSNIELDVIAICCEYSEYKNFLEIKREYPQVEDHEYLSEITPIIRPSNGNWIIRNF